MFRRSFFLLLLSQILKKIDFPQKEIKVEPLAEDLYKIEYEEDKIKSIINIKKPLLLYSLSENERFKLYINLFSYLINKGYSAIILFPEIIQAEIFYKKIKPIFKDFLEILHSGLSHKTYLKVWWKAKSGNIKILIGSRIAVFAPLKNLKYIIVENEHDKAYKDEKGIRCNIRNIAELRAKISKINIILSSHSPKISTFYKVKKGEYSIFKGNQKNKIKLKIIDIRKTRKGILISSSLYKEIRKILNSKNQVFLFLNLGLML